MRDLADLIRYAFTGHASVYSECRSHGASRLVALSMTLRYVVTGDTGRVFGVAFRARHFLLWSRQRPEA